MRKIFVPLVSIVLCLMMVIFVSAQDQIQNEEGAKYISREDRALPGQYIVVFDDSAIGPTGPSSAAPYLADQLASAYGGEVERVFQHALNGYTAQMSREAAIALSKDPRVAYVEEDGVMYASATQSNATWGLDRSDQRALPLDTFYTYIYTGSGVRVYVIDTGILTSHQQFGGRARAMYDAFGGNGQDCNGHGTHVAGTVGGSTYGVAKSAYLRGVRVLDCGGSGSTSGVIAGVDWVTANHVKPAVANMSLGGGASTALDQAVQNSINAGVTYVVAAGNENQNACNVSPSRVGSAVTVGSTTRSDVRSSFSNYGTCVDIFAPGSSITSAWYTSTTATATISGTSMASPHVAGAAALYLQANPGSSPATIRNGIINASTTNRLSSIGSGSPNRLLYTLF